MKRFKILILSVLVFVFGTCMLLAGCDNNTGNTNDNGNNDDNKTNINEFIRQYLEAERKVFNFAYYEENGERVGGENRSLNKDLMLIMGGNTYWYLQLDDGFVYDYTSQDDGSWFARKQPKEKVIGEYTDFHDFFNMMTNEEGFAGKLDEIKYINMPKENDWYTYQDDTMIVRFKFTSETQVEVEIEFKQDTEMYSMMKATMAIGAEDIVIPDEAKQALKDKVESINM